MANSDIIPAKVTRPLLVGTFDRPRLFARLDSAGDRPVVWIEAPPGAGKTILVASYLSHRDHQCLWYRVDATDHDIGSFFHHMSIAAGVACGGSETGLPRLGPEHTRGLEVFSRNYFRQLFRCVPSQVLVLDDYHEVEGESPLHKALAAGVTELPAGRRVIVLSRMRPPPAYARLQSTRALDLLDPQALLFTEEETTTLCHRFGGAHGLQATAEICDGLHRRCEGWVTGLVLMLEAWRTRGLLPNRAVPVVVFDYFAREILSRTDADTERVLLRTAMLEDITPDLASTLSGVADAHRRLDELSSRGYFMVGHQGEPPTWTCHQLFREFLIRQAESQLGADVWAKLRSRAAAALAHSGRLEQAIELYRRLEDWESLIALVSHHAPLLQTQGRLGSILRWSEGIPEEEWQRAPWLLYWTAVAQMYFDPGRARQAFERAFKLFEAVGDVRGTFLAWGMSVQTIFFEQADFSLFDQKILELEPLLERFELTDETLEAVVYTDLAQCVMWRNLDHPSRDHWLERALALQEKLPDLSARIQFLALAHSALIYTGETAWRQQVINTLQDLSASLPSSSLANTTFKAVQGFDLWTRAEFDSSEKAVKEGLAAAEATGAVMMVPLISSIAAGSAFSFGDRQLARRYLTQMGTLAPPSRRHDYSLYQMGEAWEASLTGDWHTAQEWIEQAALTLEPLGAPVFYALVDIMQAVARHHLGQTQDGPGLVQRVRERVGPRGRWPLYGATLAEAELALARGERDLGLQALAEGLAIGREVGVWNYPGWRREELSRLCAEALAADIERTYVLALIEKHQLLPPEETRGLDSWPWPLVVRCLGGLQLLLGGEPVKFSGKVPRKPLQLLELLVVRGGRQVAEDWLAYALWPDADGDAAIHALSTTLRRLRQLLQVKDLLIRRNRCLTLDRQRCWVDAWALEDELRALSQLKDSASIISAAERVIDLCRGSFMPQSSLPESADYRERLLERTVNILEHAASRLGAAGERERARSITNAARDLAHQLEATA